MARKRSAIDADMQKVYDTLPPMECKGLCQESCGPLEMSARERQRLRENGIVLEDRRSAVKRLLDGGEYTCPALTPAGQCGVYEIRPLICRLWGMVEGMPCEFGCQPEGGRLNNEQARVLIEATIAIGGEPSREHHRDHQGSGRGRARRDDPQRPAHPRGRSAVD